MRRRKMSRALAVFLAIVMCFTMTCNISFAEDNGNANTNDTKNVVVFGASTSSGYGLADFINENAGYSVFNNDLDTWQSTYEGHKQGKISRTSYPWQLKKYIADNEFDNDLSKVNLNAFTINGMRTNEIRAILDENYYQREFEQEKDTCWHYNGNNELRYCAFLGEHVDTFVKALGNGGATVERNGSIVPVYDGTNATAGSPGGDRYGVYGLDNAGSKEGYERAQQYVKEEIAKADVIVLDNCMNNFGTYMAERIGGEFAPDIYTNQQDYHKQTLNDIEEMTDETRSNVKMLRKVMVNATGFAGNQNAEAFVDAFIYCYADCVTNFSAVVDLVREINPNAKIIAVGVYDTLEGINIIVNGEEVDFGGLASKGFALVNTYIKGLDKNSNNYYYADVSGGIQTFMNQIVESDSYKALTGVGLAEDELSPEQKNGAAVIQNFWTGDDRSFYEHFIKGMEQPGDNTFYNLLQAPVKSLLYRAAKKTTLDLDRVMGNLGQMGQMQALLMDYFTACGIANTFYMTGEAGGVIDPNSGTDLWQAIAADASKAQANRAMFTAIFTDYILNNAANPLAPSDSEKFYAVTAAYTALATQQPYNFDNTTKDKSISAAYDTLIGNGYEEKNVKEAFGLSVEDELLAPSAAIMEVLHLVDRFDLYMGLGQHPSAKGCDSMAKDVIAAYKKAANGGNTAFADWKAQMLDLLRSTPAGGDIDKITAGLAKMDELMALMDEEGLTTEQLKEYLQLKKDVEARVTEILTYFGMTTDDLVAAFNDDQSLDKIAGYLEKIKKLDAAIELLESKGIALDLNEEQLDKVLQLREELTGFVNNVLTKLGYETSDLEALLTDEATADAIVEAVNKLIAVNEAIDLLEAEGISLNKEQLQSLLDLKKDVQGRFEAALGILGISMDELIQIIDENTTPEKIAEYAQQLQMIKDVLDRLPKNEADLKAELMKQVEIVKQLIGEQGVQIVTDLYEQLMAIKAQYEGEDGNIDYDKLVEELEPIFEQLKVIAVAVWNLPEYEEALDAYKQIVDELAQENADLQDRVATLENNVAMLRAKSVSVDFETAVDFSNHTCRVEVCWAIDEDADGYVLKLNEKEVEYTEAVDKNMFIDDEAQVGEVYTYEVTPYVIYEGETYNGKTYKKTIVPKVPVAKVKVKKVKAAKKAFTVKWKKVAKADGYQISYKVGKKTKYKNAKASKASLKVKKLKKGKKYTVKVRAYRTINGVKYYGAWSKAKKIKVK